jgi:hypothetical protein
VDGDWTVPERKTWVVTLAGDRPPAEVRRDLVAAGFAVGEVLEAIGVITGTADRKAVQKARRIKGIADISADTSVGIGPPDTGTTW